MRVMTLSAEELRHGPRQGVCPRDANVEIQLRMGSPVFHDLGQRLPEARLRDERVVRKNCVDIGRGSCFDLRLGIRA